VARRALRPALGDEFWPLVEASEAPAPLDLRVNALKANRDGGARRAGGSASRRSTRRYSPLGLRIDGKPALISSRSFLRGDVEVQDEGSQLLALMTGAKRGEMVVDFCAGAGRQDLALGAEMRNTGRLYAFDTSGHRLAALKPRWRAAACRTCTRCRSRTSATTASSGSPARSTVSSSTRRVQGSARCVATRT
jgi:16S rRNA (cytosine967-C5)-methyltransferase